MAAKLRAASDTCASQMARPSIVDRTKSETFEFVNCAGIFLVESALAISDILPSPTACASMFSSVWAISRSAHGGLVEPSVKRRPSQHADSVREIVVRRRTRAINLTRALIKGAIPVAYGAPVTH
jgi:hypothetical protein